MTEDGQHAGTTNAGTNQQGTAHVRRV
jgi:hypothetical protein